MDLLPSPSPSSSLSHPLSLPPPPHSEAIEPILSSPSSLTPSSPSSSLSDISLNEDGGMLDESSVMIDGDVVSDGFSFLFVLFPFFLPFILLWIWSFIFIFLIFIFLPGTQQLQLQQPQQIKKKNKRVNYTTNYGKETSSSGKGLSSSPDSPSLFTSSIGHFSPRFGLFFCFFLFFLFFSLEK